MKLLIVVCYEVALPEEKSVKGDFHGVRTLESPDDWGSHLSQINKRALEEARVLYPEALSVVFTHVHTIKWEG